MISGLRFTATSTPSLKTRFGAVAPEQLVHHKLSEIFDERTDVYYNCGDILCYWLSQKAPPFFDPSTKQPRAEFIALAEAKLIAWIQKPETPKDLINYFYREHIKGEYPNYTLPKEAYNACREKLGLPLQE